MDLIDRSDSQLISKEVLAAGQKMKILQVYLEIYTFLNIPFQMSKMVEFWDVYSKCSFVMFFAIHFNPHKNSINWPYQDLKHKNKKDEIKGSNTQNNEALNSSTA